MASVPDSSCTSTVNSSGVLDTSSIFFLMYSFSVAFWKYLDLAILSTNLKILRPVLPLATALQTRGEGRGTNQPSSCLIRHPQVTDLRHNSNFVAAKNYTTPTNENIKMQSLYNTQGHSISITTDSSSSICIIQRQNFRPSSSNVAISELQDKMAHYGKQEPN